MRPLLILLAITAFSATAFSATSWPQKPASGSGQNQGGSKHTPQAKTQPEFKDFNAAYAITGGATVEKAADEFSAKYPSSELRAYLYAKAMQEYQRENNPAKMLAMGNKVLALDPDNLNALALTVVVLSDNLNDGDLDRNEKIAEIQKNAGHILQGIDTDFMPPAGATPEQIAAYKDTLRSMAHSALGITLLKTKDYTGAEKELKSAASQPQPDPFVWYHLALAQDNQGKYADALVSAEQAIHLATPDSELAKLATGERTRLKQLIGTASSSPQAQQNSSQPPR